MSLVGFERWDLYLGCSAVGLAGPHGVARWSETAGIDDGWKLVADWLAKETHPRRWRRRRIKVCLSGASARPFVIAPARGVRRWRELLRIAEGLAPDASGLAGPCRVWLDRVGADASCLAVAAERAFIDEIEVRIRESRSMLVSIEPWWSLVLPETLSRSVPPKLVVVTDSDSVTMLSGESGSFRGASTYAPRPAEEQVHALIARAMVSGGIEAGAVLRASMGQDLVGAIPFSSGKQFAPFRAQFESCA